MRCPECGTNLFERTERNAEGTVEKTFHCYNCGSIWRPDSEDDVPECRVGKPTVPKVRVELAFRCYCVRTIFSKRPSPLTMSSTLRDSANATTRWPLLIPTHSPV